VHLRQEHGASERRACGLVGQPRSTQRYQFKAKADDGLHERVARLAAERPRFGYRRLTALLRRDGVQVGYATPAEFARASSASFAVETLTNTAAKPGQGNPCGLASLGLDPAPPPCKASSYDGEAKLTK
jgi:hypothetical protein